MDDKDAEISEDINTMQWQLYEQNTYHRTSVESLQLKLGWWKKKRMNDEEQRRKEIEEQRQKESLEIKARVRIEEEERVC